MPDRRSSAPPPFFLRDMTHNRRSDRLHRPFLGLISLLVRKGLLSWFLLGMDVALKPDETD